MRNVLDGGKGCGENRGGGQKVLGTGLRGEVAILAKVAKDILKGNTTSE